MIWVFAVVAGVVVVAIAVVAVGAVSRSLASTPATSVYDLSEATDYVTGRLPAEVAARLDRDDVEHLLGWHLTWLRGRGLATFGRVDLLATDAARDAAGPVVADEDEAVDALIARAESEGIPLDPLDAVVVLDLDAAYLRAIGAVGAVVPDPAELGDVDDDPDDGGNGPPKTR